MSQAAFPIDYDFALAMRGGAESVRPPSPPNAKTATLIGGSAVLVWSTAASFAVLGAALPPMLFIGGAFASGFFAFLGARVVRG
ncbi:MAG: hypothetical protein AAGI03_03040, partial [Pseudomonadota bacterium]